MRFTRGRPFCTTSATSFRLPPGPFAGWNFTDPCLDAVVTITLRTSLPISAKVTLWPRIGRSLQWSTREWPLPLTEACTDARGSPRASRILLIGAEPSPVIVHVPAAGFFTRMNVVPFARSCARNREVCTLGFVWDTVTFSPCGPVSVAPGGRPFPTSSHATLGSPLGTVNRATCAAAWNAGRVSL